MCDLSGQRFLSTNLSPAFIVVLDRGCREADVDGTPFGRYRLVELLGRGGMGEVWRAHDTETDRIVAIKLLPASLSADEEFQHRFRREAHAAARLNNPHVIPIHHYGEIDGQLYVDMRLIEGRDLETVLADGPLDPARAVRIIEQIARALHAAHKVGLIHRDIKPSNILLDSDDFAYLIDFGIARSIDETRMTKSGYTIGTFQYIAPERLDARAEEDARADIYSLACVLYEALTGRPPFPGDSMAHLVTAHLNTPPPRPSTTQPNVPSRVDDVIATGMAKDPNDRYATTIELADAARDAITDPIARPTPIPTQPPSGLRPIPVPPAAVTKYRQPEPPPSPWAPAAIPYPSEPLAPGMADFESNRQPVEPVPTPQPRRRAGLIAAIVATVVVLASGIIGITGYVLLKHRNPSANPNGATRTTFESDLQHAPAARRPAKRAEWAAAHRRPNQHCDGHHRNEFRWRHDRDARQQLLGLGPGVPTVVGRGASQGLCEQRVQRRARTDDRKGPTKLCGSGRRVIPLRAGCGLVLHRLHAKLAGLLQSPIHPCR